MLKLAATYAAKRTSNDKSAWHALTRGLRRQAELNRRVASDLPLAFKWLYLLTNAPFFYVGYATLRDGHALPWCGPPVPTRRPMPQPRRRHRCDTQVIAACLTFAAGSASVLFHGTQCGCWTFGPLSVPGAGWATRRVDPVFMEPSIFTNTIDVVCAVQLAIFVLACNGGLGASHWATVLVPTLGLLVSSTVLKRLRLYRTYVVIHSLWHVASACVVLRARSAGSSCLKCLFVFRS